MAKNPIANINPGEMLYIQTRIPGDAYLDKVDNVFKNHFVTERGDHFSLTTGRMKESSCKQVTDWLDWPPKAHRATTDHIMAMARMKRIRRLARIDWNQVALEVLIKVHQVIDPTDIGEPLLPDAGSPGNWLGEIPTPVFKADEE